VCALLLVPLAVMAQETEEPELQQYTSPDGFLTVSYPVDWIAQESDFLYGVTIVNSQETLDAFQAAVESEEPAPMASGQVIIEVTLASLDTFASFGIGIEEGMAPDQALEAFLTFITSPGPPPGAEGGEGAEEPAAGATEEAGMEEPAATEEPAMEEPAATEEPAAEEPAATEEAGAMELPVAGEVQTIDFEDGRQAAWATVEYPNESSDAYLLFEVSEGVYAIVDVFTAPGELTQELLDLTVAIAQSVQFTGTPEDTAMAAPEVEESDVDPSTLDGNALVDERCTVCHTRERIDQQDKDEAGWTETVDRMISYGADLDSAEREAVIQYLVETH
jgi:cytochrome c5